MDDTVNADIAVLKSEVSGLHSAISEVCAKMDVLLNMQVQLVRLQERSDQVQQEIGRIRVDSETRINAMREDFDTRLDKLRADTEGAYRLSHEVRDLSNKWLNRAIGGFFVGGLLFGCIQYFAVTELTSVKAVVAATQSNTHRLDMLEQRQK